MGPRPVDPDLYRAVAIAYRERRQAGDLDHPAFLAARKVYIEKTGDEAGAADAVPRIIHWVSENYTKWFWTDVGGKGQL